MRYKSATYNPMPKRLNKNALHIFQANITEAKHKFIEFVWNKYKIEDNYLENYDNRVILEVTNYFEHYSDVFDAFISQKITIIHVLWYFKLPHYVFNDMLYLVLLSVFSGKDFDVRKRVLQKIRDSNLSSSIYLPDFFKNKSESNVTKRVQHLDYFISLIITFELYKNFNVFAQYILKGGFVPYGSRSEKTGAGLKRKGRKRKPK